VDVGFISASQTVTFDDRPSRADFVAEEGDILFARMQATNKVVLVTSDIKDYIWSTGFAVLRPRQGANAKWIVHWLQSQMFQRQKDALCTGATQKAINNDAIAKLVVPLPPLFEQERMVQILDEVEALCHLRAQAVRHTADLIPALFHDMFGGPTRWATKSLGALVSTVSGATPSTENPAFWTGTIPWVSPKDMKADELTDATDHISDEALRVSRLRILPQSTVLIVVRGMILAHTFPVAITRVPVTINQDMKALLPTEELIPDFLHWLLISSAAKILSTVSTAGHGTKRLEMGSLLALLVTIPPKPLQHEFANRIAEIRAMQDKQTASSLKLKELFHSLLHHAYQGEL
jgi:type I restriction enzyme S subunit